MTRDEAILQMNLLGHSFFAFRDEEADGAFAVVYRRYDGDYGIIERDLTSLLQRPPHLWGGRFLPLLRGLEAGIMKENQKFGG